MAVIGAAIMLLPGTGLAQMDPNGGIPGPQAPGPQSGMDREPGSTSTTNPRTAQPASMRDSLGAPGQNGQQILDKQFIREASEGGIADVKIGTLASEKGSTDVRDLAQKMVDDHKEMNKDLESVADSMGVMLPRKMSKEQQAEYNKLSGLSGKDFDTEYMNYLAKSHWQNVHSYRMEASVAVDPGLQSAVMKALGMMREHIGMINKTAEQAGIALPPRPQHRPPQTEAKK
ncbi:MAG TPA: DUF4142 domain-containing protein [Acidobacteriaceae bacterium]|nr:DUF4142 domain-containing protein [Acidobacteriaceae bacterium]